MSLLEYSCPTVLWGPPLPVPLAGATKGWGSLSCRQERDLQAGTLLMSYMLLASLWLVTTLTLASDLEWDWRWGTTLSIPLTPLPESTSDYLGHTL